MGGSFHGELLNNQMVYHLYQPRLWPQPYQPLENSSVSSWQSMAIWRSMAAPACVSSQCPRDTCRCAPSPQPRICQLEPLAARLSPQRNTKKSVLLWSKEHSGQKWKSYYVLLHSISDCLDPLLVFTFPFLDSPIWKAIACYSPMQLPSNWDPPTQLPAMACFHRGVEASAIEKGRLVWDSFHFNERYH